MNPDDRGQPVDELLAAAYTLDGPDANRALYARWADTYESGFIADSGYAYHDRVAEVFAAHGLERVGPNDVIVDIGCGTGLAGEAVRRRAIVTIDGIDISPEMLRRAAAKQHGGTSLYRELIEADLTRPLEIGTDMYAGAVSVGTFTHGHVGPDALAEVLRIVRPSGLVAIGINAAHFSAAHFGVALEQLVRTGQVTEFRLIDVPIYDGADMHDADQFARIAVFEVT